MRDRRIGLARRVSKAGLRMCMTLACVSMVIATIAASANASAVTEMRVIDRADRVEVHAAVSGAVKASCSQSNAGKWIALDINASYGCSPVTQAIKSTNIKRVKAGWFRAHPPMVRVAVSTVAKVPFDLERKDGGNLLLTVWKSNKARVDAKAAKPAASATKPGYRVALQSPAALPKLSTSSLAKPDAPRPQSAKLGSQPLSGPVACLPVSPVFHGMAAAQPQPVYEVALATPQRPLSRWIASAGRVPTSKVAGSTEVLSVGDLQPGMVLPPSITEEGSQARLARAGGPGSTLSASTSSRDLVSLNFVGTDINDVLKALTMQAGSNIVTATDVQGEVTVALNDVNFESALNSITKLSGFQWVRDGNTYFVGTDKSINGFRSAGDPRTEVVMLAKATPSSLQEILKTQYPSLTVSVPDDSDEGKQLLIAGPGEDVDSAKLLLAQLDSSLGPTGGDEVVEVYRVRYSNAKSLISILNTLVPRVGAAQGALPAQTVALHDGSLNANVPGSVGAGMDTGGADSGSSAPQAGAVESRVLILSGRPADIARAREVLAKVDVASPQVLIEAKVVDLRKTDSQRIGIEYDWTSNGYSFGVINQVNNLDQLSQPQNVDPTLRALPMSITAILDAEIVKGNGKLLASPKISAIENQPATIFIGDQVRYVQSIQSTQSGINVTTETLNVGVELRCIAQVSPDDGQITLQIHPEASVISDWVTIADAGVTLPQVARRFADSTIRVKDGETIVIGGLIRESEIETLKRIPLLSDLPFFGQLFRHRSTTAEQSEIMIFITSTILDDVS